MIQPGMAIRIVKMFFDAYLVQRNINQALSCLTETIHWFGTGKSEMVCGRDQAEQVLKAEFTKEPESSQIEYENIKEFPGRNDCAFVIFTATVYPDHSIGRPIWFRTTCSCLEDVDGVCRIASIHASIPQSQLNDGGFFPASSLSPSEMENQLGVKALDILGKNIPGGMMGGYLEPGFPLYYVNNFMLSYLGYTYEEFVHAVDGKVINCMHPDDRLQVDALVREAFGYDSTYEVQYRMKKKDGTYIWVNDVGKKGWSEDGREVCISVIRDITEEREARIRLEQQAQEQRHLADQHNHLLQSVLCGIVQYQSTSKGIVFKNANREAIRIFGYTQKEFWDKQYWSVDDLVAKEDQSYIINMAAALKNPGEKSNFEYRLCRKDGGTCWIIGSAEVMKDSDGELFVQSVYLDIHEKKAAEQRNQRLSEQLEASNEILHLALENTTTCEYYYYPETREGMVPPRTCSMYHCQEHYEDFPCGFSLEQVDDPFRPAFYKMFESIHRGERTASCEFQGGCQGLWCRHTLSVILSNEDGTPRLAIGIVENITRQKKAEEELLHAKTRDSLTGLYKKESGIRLVQDYMSHKAPGDHCVMMLLDMDDFASVNQKEGRLFSDVILQEVADILRAETKPEDIRIRLGGDEFMLLLKNSNKAQAVNIGPQIADQVQNILINAEKDINVSVSIGMCSTEVVEEYNAIYRCCESTLKYVKEHCKGHAACYLDTSNELGVYLTQLYTEEHLVNAIEMESSRLDDDLVLFALDLLGKSKNLDDAVFLLLSRIGKRFGFDRVSIIEANPSYLTYRFSYQWARNREDIQLGQDFYVSEQDFYLCSNMYDEEGLADHNIRDGISHIASCLHAGIWDYGKYAGSMSFEINEKDYKWTKEHRKLLKELVKVIPSFIMKSRADAVSRAKTDFLSRMSHEIRTPMNAISGMTTIAKSVLDDKQKAFECLEKIEAANTFLLSLINDILDMSRIESGKLELNYGSMDLAQQMAGLEALFHGQAEEKNLKLIFENGYSSGRALRADSLRFNQIFVNIIGNAIKFTKEGRVTVRIETLETFPQAVLRFSITDTGIGIESSAITRIFNAFEQADSRTAAGYGGTGLGLSISSRLVQLMGGNLEVTSEVGKGSEFFFTLAFDYAQETLPDSPQKTVDPLPDFHGHRILLAEDNELNREIAQTILEMNGFAVTCADDGKAALTCFCNSEPGYFDAILMDIRMPVMDGLESARRIRTSDRSDSRSVPIIALTANAFDEDTKKSIASGMNGHLSKPIQLDKLLELLGKCMSQQLGI